MNEAIRALLAHVEDLGGEVEAVSTFAVLIHWTGEDPSRSWASPTGTWGAYTWDVDPGGWGVILREVDDYPGPDEGQAWAAFLDRQPVRG